jgi:hypothetical protein
MVGLAFYKDKVTPYSGGVKEIDILLKQGILCVVDDKIQDEDTEAVSSGGASVQSPFAIDKAPAVATITALESVDETTDIEEEVSFVEANKDGTNDKKSSDKKTKL